MSVHDPYQCPWQWSHCDSLIRRVCVQFIHTADISGWTLWGSAESLFQSTLGKKTCKEGSQHWLKRSVDFATFVQSDHQPCRRPWSSDGPFDSPPKEGVRDDRYSRSHTAQALGEGDTSLKGGDLGSSKLTLRGGRWMHFSGAVPRQGAADGTLHSSTSGVWEMSASVLRGLIPDGSPRQ